MSFSAAQLNRCLLVLGVAWAACSAEAQPAGRRPGQAIIFSSPDDEGVSTNLPSLTAKPPALLDLANTVQSPGANLGAASGAEPAMAPPDPAVYPAPALPMRRRLDQQKNWTQQTPEEILGLPTPKQILGITDRNAPGQAKNETAMARYSDRPDQSQFRTNDDHYGLANLALRRDFSDESELQFNPDIWTPAGGKSDNPVSARQFLNTTMDRRTASVLGAQSGWSKSFNLPAPPPKPTPEQEAAMEQFRQLLEPHAPPGGPAKAEALARPIFAGSAEVPVAASPLGAAYAPLNSGISTPVGVSPLPRLFNQTNAMTIYEPAWKPQPPPWASSAPQLDVMPQRKF